ncbi:MAG: M23 family metallopeptidase [Desulfobacterales bacterium]|nr:M23 family metallopeptidase [Desulfobacterales bacterium]
MPSKKVTFLIVPENTSNVKQIKLSKAFTSFLMCLILFGLSGASFILYDYIRLKKTSPSRRALEREVTSQRAQLQAFAQKIHDLNSEMIALQGFEKKIRIIANVEKPAGQDAVFGIGGTGAEGLGGAAPLTESHNSLIRGMHANVDLLDEASAVQKHAFEELHGYLQRQKSLLASTPAIRPTKGWVSSQFGYRISPFTGLKAFHRGLDIATRESMPIIAPADGMIKFVGRKRGLGNFVVIDHGHGVVTRYGHLKKWLVKAGTRVKRGDKIGLVGNTGRSTAPHLHYEVHLNGIPVNPAKYILN